MRWFDQPKNSTGKLTTRLSHDAAQVQGVSKFTYFSNECLKLEVHNVFACGVCVCGGQSF